MICQLREYVVRAGEMQEWLDEWRRLVVPLRRKFGFRVLGAWTVEAENRFVWIVGHDGATPWKEADRAYYESAERKALEPDPARHLLETSTRLMSPVDTA